MNSLATKYTTTKFRCQQFMEEKARSLKNFLFEERGDTTIIAIVLVLVVVIGLAVIFRDNIVSLANKAWDSVFKNSGNLQGSGKSFTTDSWTNGN